MSDTKINKVTIVTNGAKLRPVHISNQQFAHLIDAAARKRPELFAYGKILVRPSEIDAIEVENVS